MEQYIVEIIKPKDIGCEWRAFVTLEAPDIIFAVNETKCLFSDRDKIWVVSVKQTS